MTTAEVANDEAAVLDAWEVLGPTILRSWIRRRPGTRPWGWWKFNAIAFEAGRRRRIDGKLHPFDCKERSLHIAQIDRPGFWRKAYALHWGLPATFVFPFDADLYQDYMANRLTTKLFEGEWEFLLRHNLLTPEDSP